MDEYIVKEQKLKKFLEDISRISNEKYQERVWIRAEGPECDDIDDAISDFFNDGAPILESHRDFDIWDVRYKELMVIHKKLIEFADTFNVFGLHKSTEKLIKLPQWQEIRNMAKNIVQSFGCLTHEGRKSILNDFLGDISNMTDKEYQERFWIQGEGPDFNEAVCWFFDRAFIWENYKDYGITESQYHLLTIFRNEFEAFSDENNWPPDFIDTPKWEKIMDRAKELLKAFNYQKDFGSNTKNGTAPD